MNLQKEKFLLSSHKIDSILWSLVRALDLKCLIIHENGVPYLARFYLHNGDKEKQISLYLHYFFSSDDADFLHNHPWEKSLSLILTGGYTEEWFLDHETTPVVKATTYLPGDMNSITSEKFHRVELTQPGCWSLFMGTDKLDDWLFWGKKTKEYEHWVSRNDRIKTEPAEYTTATDNRLEIYRSDAFNRWNKKK